MTTFVATITSDGETMDPTIELMSLEIRKGLDRIPEAKLVVLDGNPAERTFPVSDTGFFRKARFGARWSSDLPCPVGPRPPRSTPMSELRVLGRHQERGHQPASGRHRLRQPVTVEPGGLEAPVDRNPSAEAARHAVPRGAAQGRRARRPAAR